MSSRMNRSPSSPPPIVIPSQLENRPNPSPTTPSETPAIVAGSKQKDVSVRLNSNDSFQARLNYDKDVRNSKAVVRGSSSDPMVSPGENGTKPPPSLLPNTFHGKYQQLPSQQRNVFAMINIKSGERLAAEFVYRELVEVLGSRRSEQEPNGLGSSSTNQAAYSVSSPTILATKNKTVLKLEFGSKWRDEAVAFIANNIRMRTSESEPPRENILIVAGGDGTVGLAVDLLNETGLLAVLPPNRSVPTEDLRQNILEGENEPGDEPNDSVSMGATKNYLGESVSHANLASKKSYGSLGGGAITSSTTLAATTSAATDLGATAATVAALAESLASPLAATAKRSFFHRDFIIHISIIPMGTGNDLSRSLGFGPGFVRGVGPCSCCGADTMRPMIERTFGGEPVAVDLWQMSVRPAFGAGAIRGGVSGKGARGIGNNGEFGWNVASPNAAAAATMGSTPVSAKGIQREDTFIEVQNTKGGQQRSKEAKYGESTTSAEAQVTVRRQSTMVYDGNNGLTDTPDQGTSNATSRNTRDERFSALRINTNDHENAAVIDQTSSSPNDLAANGPNKNNSTIVVTQATTKDILSPGSFNPSDRQNAHPSLITEKFNFVNYFSVGFDAQICTEFHHFREAHKTLCSTRVLNKFWYGLLGLKALVGEPILKSKYVSLIVDGRRIAIPTDVKSIVISNVVSFAGGVSLWKTPTAGKMYTHADGTLVGESAQVKESEWGDKGLARKPGESRAGSSEAANTPLQPPPRIGAYVPADVGDGLLEVQGLFGTLHMSMLQLSVRHSIKIAQGAKIELVITYPHLLELYGKEKSRIAHERFQRQKEETSKIARREQYTSPTPSEVAQSKRGRESAMSPNQASLNQQEMNSVKNIPPTPNDGRASSEPIFANGGKGAALTKVPLLQPGTPSSATTPSNNPKLVSAAADGYSPSTSPQLPPDQVATATTTGIAQNNNTGVTTAITMTKPTTTAEIAFEENDDAFHVELDPKAIEKLRNPLATQLDGEAMEKVDKMLREYGAVTILITHRQKASMLHLNEKEGNL